jgi:hypothetical protein
LRRTFCTSTKSLVLLFCGSAGILFNFLIPPFQNPDETEHFGLILTYSLGPEKKAYIEKEIIQLIDSSSWWRFVGLGRPPVLPDSFMKMDFLSFRNFRDRVGGATVYHYLLGKIQKVFFKGGILSFYYLCRLISIGLMTASLFLVYLSFKKLSGLTTRLIFLASFFSILFLPQLMTISVSVNPDGLSFFLSALFFFAFFSLVTKNSGIRYLLVLFLAAGLSFFADRSVFFLVIMLVLAPFFWIKKKSLKHDLGLMLIFSLVSILVVAWIAWYLPAPFYDNLAALPSFALAKPSAATGLVALSTFGKSFLLFLVDSFFLKFGWMAFSAERIFYYLLHTFVLLSLLGILIYLGKYRQLGAKKPNSPLSNPLIPKLILFFAMAVGLQVLGVWLPCRSKNILPQGRYLYPAIIPIVFLFWLGIDRFFSVFHRTAGRVAVCALVIGEFFFLNYVIWNDIIPVFHLTVQAPHPGI